MASKLINYDQLSAAISVTKAYIDNLVTTGTIEAALKLANPRKINGTNFDGTADITTDSWGKPRTITIGNKSQSVDGSGDITFSLDDIGAAPGKLVTTSVASGKLTLSTEKYQYATISANTTIVLPSVSSFTEIHLFFEWPSSYSITLPSAKWQYGMVYGTSNAVHEFIFTYINSTVGWLAGCVVYE